MKLLYINPNSTDAMTQSVVTVARRALPHADIIGWTNTDGPPAIQGPADGTAAIPGLLAMLPHARDIGVDAIVIACFDDTGLMQIRQMAHCPVLGIGQSAYVAASLLGNRFAVVTTLAVSVPVIAQNITQLGYGAACAAVVPSDLPVLTVEDGSPETLAHLADVLTQTAQKTGADHLVLGCAGMAAWHDDLHQRTGLRLIDGVRASALLARAAAGF